MEEKKNKSATTISKKKTKKKIAAKKLQTKKVAKRGRPKGSGNKKRKTKVNTPIFSIPIGEKFTFNFVNELVNWVNANSKSKKTMGAVTDGNLWWIVFS